METPTRPLPEYLEAMTQWEMLKKEVREYFSRYDLFLAPTVPMPSFPTGRRSSTSKGRR